MLAPTVRSCQHRKHSPQSAVEEVPLPCKRGWRAITNQIERLCPADGNSSWSLPTETHPSRDPSCRARFSETQSRGQPCPDWPHPSWKSLGASDGRSYKPRPVRVVSCINPNRILRPWLSVDSFHCRDSFRPYWLIKGSSCAIHLRFPSSCFVDKSAPLREGCISNLREYSHLRDRANPRRPRDGS